MTDKREEFGSRTFDLANELALSELDDKHKHLAGILHCVASGLNCEDCDVWLMIDEFRGKMALLDSLKKPGSVCSRCGYKKNNHGPWCWECIP